MGPSRTTPANTQCQKCLKRGHYSYECKAEPQERPYVPRPSRTQQLVNPKLRPELSNDIPDFLQKKSGIADAELAKKAAQRMKRETELRGNEDEVDGTELKVAHPRAHSPQNRQRSRSYGSLSSSSSRSPASPPPERAPPSPSRSRGLPLSQRRSHSPGSDRSYSRSLSRSLSPVSLQGRVESQHSEPSSRRVPSPNRPPRESERRKVHGHRDSPNSEGRSRSPRRREIDHPDPYTERPRQHSISPRREPSIDNQRGRGITARQYRDRGDSDARHGTRQDPSSARPNIASQREGAPRERSLSPFSRRMALTQAMGR